MTTHTFSPKFMKVGILTAALQELTPRQVRDADPDRANEILQKDPSLIVDGARQYAHLPGGHQEAWSDAFCNLMRDIYGAIAAGKPYRSLPPTVATFEDGYRANRIVEAILESAGKGGVWTEV